MHPSADEKNSLCLLEALAPDEVIFGHSDSMQLVRQAAERVAQAGVPVLIHGESGTGKSVLAKWLHRRSARRCDPFVTMNCAAVPALLLRSELFGYEKGAFTGAAAAKPGWVELADRGTLFLDEICELDLSSQAALLQLLQEGEYCRIGGHDTRRADVFFMCASKRDLKEDISAGRFREDLYYRVSVMSLRLAPLRERRCDIPQLAEHFLGVYGAKYQTPMRPFSMQMMQLLMDHDWPGNIRELESYVKTYAILGSEESISADLARRNPMALSAQRHPEGRISLRDLSRSATSEFERKTILQVLQANHWNRREAARALNISYRSLFYKMRAAGIGPKKAARSVPLPLLFQPVDGDKKER